MPRAFGQGRTARHRIPARSRWGRSRPFRFALFAERRARRRQRLQILAGALPLAEAQGVLSALYAVDLFLGNWDRHADNLMIEHDAVAPRIRVMDFSEAPALIDPAQRGKIPSAATATVVVGRALRTLYGFSLDAAMLALDRLDAVTGSKMKEITDCMPTDWLPAAARSDLLNWWSSSDRSAHIVKVRTGISDGSLL